MLFSELQHHQSVRAICASQELQTYIRRVKNYPLLDIDVNVQNLLVMLEIGFNTMTTTFDATPVDEFEAFMLMFYYFNRFASSACDHLTF